MAANENHAGREGHGQREGADDDPDPRGPAAWSVTVALENQTPEPSQQGKHQKQHDSFDDGGDGIHEKFLEVGDELIIPELSTPCATLNHQYGSLLHGIF